MTSQLQSTLQSLEPALEVKLRKIVADREADVETMRSRTTPWKTFFEEKHDTAGHAKITGRIKRIGGVGKADSGDGLERIERWAEEVVSPSFPLSLWRKAARPSLYRKLIRRNCTGGQRSLDSDTNSLRNRKGTTFSSSVRLSRLICMVSS